MIISTSRTTVYHVSHVQILRFAATSTLFYLKKLKNNIIIIIFYHNKLWNHVECATFYRSIDSPSNSWISVNAKRNSNEQEQYTCSSPTPANSNSRNSPSLDTLVKKNSITVVGNNVEDWPLHPTFFKCFEPTDLPRRYKWHKLCLELYGSTTLSAFHPDVPKLLFFFL